MSAVVRVLDDGTYVVHVVCSDQPLSANVERVLANLETPALVRRARAALNTDVS